MSSLTPEWLRHLLHYDPLTGLWMWVNPLKHSKMRPGDRAGRLTQSGYWQLRVETCYFYSAPLAHFYMLGCWPEHEMDHINRIKSDDRWENLRPATRSENAYNRDWCEANGDMRGITPHGHQFSVSIGGQYLGLHRTLEEAKTVRDMALQEWAGPFAINQKRNVS